MIFLPALSKRAKLQQGYPDTSIEIIAME